MSKRRRDEEGGFSVPTKKPKKSLAGGQPNFDQIRVCQEIYDALRGVKGDGGRLICDIFLRAPSRRSAPEYYKVVTNAIDFMRIQQKLKTEEYENVEQLSADICLLVDNARLYFKKGTAELKDAEDLWAAFVEIKQKALNPNYEPPKNRDPSPALSNRSLRSSSPGRSAISRDSPARLSVAGNDPVDVSVLDEFLASVVELTDETGRTLCPPFRLLPNEKDFPEYFESIKEPLDLKTIAERIQSGKYKTLNDLEKAILLVCKNAKSFNEPGSMIYKDAMAIRKFVAEKKAKLQENAVRPISKDRAAHNAEILDELLRAPPGDDDIPELSEDSEEDEATESSPDPKWALYWTIRNFRDPGSELPLAEVFCELPDKSWYPDYYDEIKDPISLYIINKKLKRGEYRQFVDLVKDMNLICTNAKSYNIEGSEIHTNACRLQVLCNRKAKELDPTLNTAKLPLEPPPGISLFVGGGIDIKPHNNNSTPPEKKSHKKRVAVDGQREKGRPGRKTLEELMVRYKGKLMQVVETVWHFRDANGRWVSELFIDPPDPQQYPDYYNIIPEPMFLRQIKGKIEAEKYANSKEMIDDFDIMFRNARHYNEEGSSVYKDSETLDAVLRTAVKELGPMVLESPRVLKEKFGKLQPAFVSTPLRTHSLRLANTYGSWHDHQYGPVAGRRSEPRFIKTQSGRVAVYYPEGWRTLFSWAKTRTTGTPPVGEAGRSSLLIRRPSGAFSPLDKRTETARKKSASETAQHRQLWSLYSAIKDFTDSRGRLLSTIFMKLPSRHEYPDYYEVIKKPIDIQRIGNRVACHSYESLDALVADFVLMFDNACRYNEPESVIYKDALTLQKVLLQKKAELKGSECNGSVPDVRSEVQELLTTLFVTVYNHQDEEGRCYSDSLAEIPELVKDKSTTLLTFDAIKRNLEKGRYRRLDRFQEDIFSVLEQAREIGRSDSQLFEDSAELQFFFLKTRDELCKRGEWFLSPARFFDERHLSAQLEEQKKAKAPLELKEDSERPEDPKTSPQKKKATDTELESIEVKDVEYSVGDFVYIRSGEENSNLEPHIMRIERIWKDEEETFVSGLWFYRPYETYHLATRKFMTNEVFKTSFRDKSVADRLMGKCYVMFAKKYFKYSAKDFDPKDVYVCECEYHGRILHFKKIKHWPYNESDEELEARKEPLVPTRVPSIFAGATPKSAEEARIKAELKPDEDDEDDDLIASSSDMTILQPEREEVELNTAGTSEEITFYEQICYNGFWLKLGDGVYVRNHYREYTSILRVDKLWRNSEGDSYLSGPWFPRPIEVDHEPSRMFYKREVFGTEKKADSVVNLSQVLGRCAVLAFKDYCSYRPTEIREEDVYVCQWKVLGDADDDSMMNESFPQFHADAVGTLEGGDDSNSNNGELRSPPPPNGAPMSESSARKFKSLKAYKLSERSLDNEYYYFRKPVDPEKEPSPLLMKTDTSVDMDTDMNDESMSEADRDRGSEHSQINKDMASWLATQPKLNSRSKSGYILFSAEVRKRIMADHTDATFGEISKMVGLEWKKLNEEEKKQFEARAQVIAGERERIDALKGGGKGNLQPGQVRVFCCKWKDCDYQFETTDLLYDHMTSAHTSQIGEAGENQFVCLWSTCAKYRKDGKPFPSLPRLHRHIKEKHLPAAGKNILPSQRSRHYFYLPGHTPPPAPSTPVHSQPGFQFATPSGGQGQFYQTYTPGQAPPPGTVFVDANGQVVTPAPGATILTGHPPGQIPFGVIASSSSSPASSSQTAYQQSQHISATPQQQVQIVNSNGMGHVMSGSPVIVQQQTPAAPPGYPQDPGRTIVQASEPAEPVFVPPPNSVRVNRVLHSETYLRYIESLSNSPQQQSVSKWDRSLGASNYNTPMTHQKPPPVEMLGDSAKNMGKEEVVKALWNLRDYMLKDALQISRVLAADEL